MLALVQLHVGAPAAERAIGGAHFAALARFRQDDIDQSVYSVGAIFRTARPAHDFDGVGDLVVRLDQGIDVAKGRGAGGDTVLEDQEAALPGPAGQHRRADGNQMLLPGIHLHVHAGQLVQYFGRVVCGGGVDFGSGRCGEAAGIGELAVAENADRFHPTHIIRAPERLIRSGEVEIVVDFNQSGDCRACRQLRLFGARILSYCRQSAKRQCRPGRSAKRREPGPIGHQRKSELGPG